MRERERKGKMNINADNGSLNYNLSTKKKSGFVIIFKYFFIFSVYLYKGLKNVFFLMLIN